MREITLRFGDDNHLVGTLTPAAAGAGPSAAPEVGVLLMNAGVIHRIGPHRINVKLARQLARAGVPALRFDLSGLGDSQRPTEPRPMGEQAMRDMRAALDRLSAETGVRRFLMIGDCSAAEYGYLCALADARVSDLVMIDGYSFGNARTRRLRYSQRLASATPAIWRQAMVSRLRRWLGLVPAGAKRVPVDFGLPDVDAQGFAAGLGQLIGRGTRVYLIYSGSILHRYNHASQYTDVMLALPGLSAEDRERLGRVRCDFVPTIDHTVTPLSAQRDLIERICGWFSAR